MSDQIKYIKKSMLGNCKTSRRFQRQVIYKPYQTIILIHVDFVYSEYAHDTLKAQNKS